MKIEVDTWEKSAFIQKNVTVNLAQGEAESILKQNEANVRSLTKVQNSQTEAYSLFKSHLNMQNSDLVDFIKAKLVKNFQGQDITLNIKSPE